MFSLPEISHDAVEAARELRELRADRKRFEWVMSRMYKKWERSALDRIMAENPVMDYEPLGALDA